MTSSVWQTARHLIGGDPFLSAAVQHDPALIEDAMKVRVIIATPATLVALLKAVAYGWQQQDMLRHAQEIGDSARNLFERICRFADIVGRERVIAGTDCGFGTFAGFLTLYQEGQDESEDDDGGDQEKLDVLNHRGLRIISSARLPQRSLEPVDAELQLFGLGLLLQQQTDFPGGGDQLLGLGRGEQIAPEVIDTVGHLQPVLGLLPHPAALR